MSSHSWIIRQDASKTQIELRDKTTGITTTVSLSDADLHQLINGLAAVAVGCGHA